MNFNKYKNKVKQHDVIFNKVNYEKNLKKLFSKKNKSLGRSKGQIVSWHRGGGVKRSFRNILDYKTSFWDYYIVRSIQYDPNRSAFIGIIQNSYGSFSHTIVPSKSKLNDIFLISKYLTPQTINGDSLSLKNLPIGLSIFNIEKFRGSGAIYSKSAGSSSIIIDKSIKYCNLKLPSGEERLFDINCMATLGVPSNDKRHYNKKYKAGTSRLLNKRPIVRGVAMNPIDHPHGGGAAKSGPGRPSVSPWGKLAKGVPTRNKRLNNKLIIKRYK